MSAPSFSPITNGQRKFPAPSGSPRKHASAAAAHDSKPKYECPGCHQLFSKWSPCLAHLREKQHVKAELLDKRLNGGDFRRIQEMCATLAYHNSSGNAGTRDRTESLSSVDSLSSDSGGEEDEGSATAPNGRISPGNRRTGQPKHRFAPTATSLQTVTTFSRINSPSSSNRTKSVTTSGHHCDLRSLEERIFFRILTFLDVESSRMLFHAMTIVPRSATRVSESRVRMWSVSSDPDSSSLPSFSPSSSHKHISTSSV